MATGGSVKYTGKEVISTVVEGTAEPFRSIIAVAPALPLFYVHGQEAANSECSRKCCLTMKEPDATFMHMYMWDMLN